jgi:hypothetical protein
MLRPYTKKAFWFCEGRFFLPVVGTLYSIGLALFLFVVVTDPYNLRADNAKVSLTDHHGYSEDVTGRLASIVAKGDYDLVVVGGSATMGFTTEMLRAAFPESRRAFNLSFVGITPEEERIILRLLLNSKALKRLVLSVDVTLAQQASKPYGYFPMYHYQHPWHVLAPEFSFETLLLSFRVATTGVLDSPQWWRGELPNRFVYAQPLPSREGEMQKLQKAVDAMRAAPKSHKEVACESVYWLERMVMPLVRDFWSRDVNVDLVFPPYFLAVYADWEFNFPAGAVLERGSVYANLQALKRCVVEAAETLSPRVRVHAFDTDLDISARPENYFDTSHIIRTDVYRRIISGVANQSRQLSQSNFAEFDVALRQAVLDFNVNGESRLKTVGDH